MASARREERSFSPIRMAVVWVAAFVGYYGVFYYAVRAQNLGVFLVAIPQLLLLALLASSAALVALSAENLIVALRRVSAMQASAGSATFAAGVAVASCACSSPVIASALYLLGANALQVSSVLAVVADHQVEMVSILVLVNLVLAVWGGLRMAARQAGAQERTGLRDDLEVEQH